MNTQSVSPAPRSEVRERPPRPQTPGVDLFEGEHGFVLLADMPGVTADGIEVHFDRDRLIIRGHMQAASATPAYAEYEARDYLRTFQVLDEIDTDKVQAKLVDGVLQLELPKSPRNQARKIPIQS
jgi:HSP20 family molecular chaperone IbpA